METTIIYINDKGQNIAQLLKAELPHAEVVSGTAILTHRTKEEWTGRAIVFIGALGICVRSIVPLIHDKHTDPAVVCVDSLGKQAISVLSGHVGGANELCRRVARILGAVPVITTQSDVEGTFAHGEKIEALDLKAKQEGLVEELRGVTMNEAIADYLDQRGTVHIETTYRYWPHEEGKKELLFRPPVLHLGVGCSHGCVPGLVPQRIVEALHEAGFSEKSVATIDTIELKRHEPLLEAIRELMPQARIVIHREEDLQHAEVPNPSHCAMKYVGIPSVSEATAMTYGPLLIEKQKGRSGTTDVNDYTFALSISTEAMESGHIEIVGAGPGDPELISVRGKRFLEEADLILYAGSLVPERLTHYAHPGCVVRSSASMNLEQQFALMKEFYDQGKLIVRLHTGDPCIYGAIQEQMALFDAHGMHYHITPGISAFQAAAAALHSQFTIPEKVQTIILTRGEGRTPMPEKEQLHKLAQSQSTMCIYLSAAIAEEVQRELLEAYPPETPVAACYKLTWPEEKIYRGQLKDLAKIVKDHHLTLTTLLVVGDAIDNRQGLSRLYADEFKHLFRGPHSQNAPEGGE